MQLYPAIDLMSGQAVRLKQGDFQQQTFFGDALTIAKRFKEDGATAIHLIDLDGAKAGEPLHLSLIADIKKETDLFVEAGGGVRNIETVEAYVGAGIDRILIGTVALEDEALLEQMIERAGDKLAVALDAKDGIVQTRGWLEASDWTLDRAIEHLIQKGIKTFLYTDISRDGMMQGPDVDGLDRLKRDGVELIASGGVTTVEDVARLKEIGMDGAVIGRALLDGSLSLKEVLRVC
ncbi:MULTISPECIES: 1-(5-phosphoribosyl)-5-[(5-phosphoribosylamino)methylideneamino]imidazole-4-carboxamide isomerase [Exiguobacterium]|uniref:1-(5-phosphoribosyl)-5-[(5- phosphoribosylamino)methylideneamino]imidazole-4- carboxamide isomerase n=1 Tax=Exiguobacterium TaxID=33986 RepID=UPI001AEA9E1C|nr:MULTISPECIES: 1-(5-phosphoribosyl)-5-[(5-phosphoribosylamino)methylideneamino]imidazole-4-carboxamide isomerase [Exiguobacterium]MCT4778874.1 1-(5-phosphoribosyl)-5-[(5-phosphoribosylamino)methylideneamino]imidazole-4-carboxamide isomerase [Exiguobacterium soli]